MKDYPGWDGFGMFHQDGTPKIAATYLHNLTTILADESSKFTPKPLSCCSGRMAFQLVVWDERAPYGDGKSNEDSVTVNLGGINRKVQIFDPTTGTAAVASYENVDFVTLKLSNHPVIVQTVGP
jgi:hypothetical protein